MLTPCSSALLSPPQFCKPCAHHYLTVLNYLTVGEQCPAKDLVRAVRVEGAGGVLWSCQSAQVIGHPEGPLWAPAAQRRRSPAPRRSSTQWATAGAPEASCGKEWWARKGKEPPTKPGCSEPRTTARPPCSVNHPGHHAGAHATRVNHNGAHATHDRQGARHAHARPMEWWSAGCGRPVQRAEEWGTWASRTRNCGEAGGGRPLSGGVWAAKTVKRPLQQPAQLRNANYGAPLTHKRHLPQPAQLQYTSDGAPRTRK